MKPCQGMQERKKNMAKTRISSQVPPKGWFSQAKDRANVIMVLLGFQSSRACTVGHDKGVLHPRLEATGN
jgi:hypothetical protein